MFLVVCSKRVYLQIKPLCRQTVPKHYTFVHTTDNPKYLASSLQRIVALLHFHLELLVRALPVEMLHPLTRTIRLEQFAHLQADGRLLGAAGRLMFGRVLVQTLPVRVACVPAQFALLFAGEGFLGGAGHGALIVSVDCGRSEAGR